MGSPGNARQEQLGTGMLIGSSIGFVAFGALALDRRSVGLGLGLRF